mgnify:CR=1 FL=1
MDVPTQVKLSFPDKDKVMEFNIEQDVKQIGARIIYIMGFIEIIYII